LLVFFIASHWFIRGTLNPIGLFAVSSIFDTISAQYDKVRNLVNAKVSSIVLKCTSLRKLSFLNI
uniref:ABC transmembrane type-1 domain-containing protein n=1 Tax=Ascaris lumbricoides TaxID=6252 RepID=A0A0M3IGW1_ASCLU